MQSTTCCIGPGRLSDSSSACTLDKLLKVFVKSAAEQRANLSHSDSCLGFVISEEYAQIASSVCAALQGMEMQI